VDKGENQLQPSSRTQAEAWWQAILQAGAVGMLEKGWWTTPA
jgi:hypothetical protein